MEFDDVGRAPGIAVIDGTGGLVGTESPWV